MSLYDGGTGKESGSQDMVRGKRDFVSSPCFARIQSPSSINTYRQCPRKYYYQYIEKIETGTNIHLVRGKVVHSVLEDFFSFDISKVPESGYDFVLKIILHEFLGKRWKEAEDDLESLGMEPEKIKFYLEESRDMLQFWLIEFLRQLKSEILRGKSLKEAFEYLSPKTEVHYISETYGVQGYIDVIQEKDGQVCLLDYKTSSRDKISDDYYLQLGIYAMLFHEKHGILPDTVGIHFLKFEDGIRLIPADEKIVEYAKSECRKIHGCTSSDNINDYPKKESRLCRWSTGKCDFYNICIKNRDEK